MTVTADIWMPGANDPSFELRFTSWEVAEFYIRQYIEMGATAVVSMVDEPLVPEGTTKPVLETVH